MTYLFENWGARRAAFKPYFFLSFIRVGEKKQLIIVLAKPKPPKARRRRSRRLAKAMGDDYATVEGPSNEKDFAKKRSLFE